MQRNRSRFFSRSLFERRRAIFGAWPATGADKKFVDRKIYFVYGFTFLLSFFLSGKLFPFFMVRTRTNIFTVALLRKYSRCVIGKQSF